MPGATGRPGRCWTGSRGGRAYCARHAGPILTRLDPSGCARRRTAGRVARSGMPARGCRWHNPLVAEISSDVLLRTPTVVVRDVHCLGRCRDRSAEEASKVVHLAFPYRGVFVRHLGDDDAVAEANQVVLFNPGEGYRVSHPVAGGDDSLSLDIVEPVLR